MIQPLLRSFARVKTRITTHEGAQQFSQFPANPISPTSGHCIRPAKVRPVHAPDHLDRAPTLPLHAPGPGLDRNLGPVQVVQIRVRQRGRLEAALRIQF